MSFSFCSQSSSCQNVTFRTGPWTTESPLSCLLPRRRVFLLMARCGPFLTCRAYCWRTRKGEAIDLWGDSTVGRGLELGSTGQGRIQHRNCQGVSATLIGWVGSQNNVQRLRSVLLNSGPYVCPSAPLFGQTHGTSLRRDSATSERDQERLELSGSTDRRADHRKGPTLGREGATTPSSIPVRRSGFVTRPLSSGLSLKALVGTIAPIFLRMTKARLPRPLLQKRVTAHLLTRGCVVPACILSPFAVGAKP